MIPLKLAGVPGQVLQWRRRRVIVQTEELSASFHANNLAADGKAAHGTGRVAQGLMVQQGCRMLVKNQ